jgi:prepilin-type N-terminal cleavage/methylation domain-containing protein
MKNKKAFTLVELLAVIVVLGIILVIAIPNIIKLIDQARVGAYERQKDLIVDAATKYVLQNEKNIVWTNNTATIYLSDLQNAHILDNPLKDPRGGTFNNTKYGTKITVTRSDNRYTYTLTAITGDVTIPEYVDSEGVNRPKLITGMTPIKWDGKAWVDTVEDDADWYNYTTADKEWANARTKDNSMWVWIPRYAYQIASNYHLNTVGTINVKFLKNATKTASDDTTVDTVPTYNSENSQTNYILHPAFTFGTTEVTGIWVAKFEASVSDINDLCYTSESAANCNITTLIPKIVPNAKPWRYINVNNIFTVSKNMETNNIYGWGSTGTGLDTHMMKNTEWGAATYLAQSTYGQNSEIWINPAHDFTTGCAGDTVSSSPTTGCLRTYDTTQGMSASTTGNTYGIYDMSGGSWEYTAAHITTADASLETYGNSLRIADNKYKDVYTVTTDNAATNYDNASTKKGDALYETSSSGFSTTAWNSDEMYMAYGNCPFFLRGGYHSSVGGGGTFSLSFNSGDAANIAGFRPVLLIDSKL